MLRKKQVGPKIENYFQAERTRGLYPLDEMRMPTNLILHAYTITLGCVTCISTWVPGRTIIETWDSTEFCYTITDEMWDRTPDWSQNNESPPMSIRSAVKKANEGLKLLQANGMVEKIPPNEDAVWEIEHIGLKKLDGDKWFWRIEFEYKRNSGGSSGVTEPAIVIVLMDGTILLPTRTDSPPSDSHK